MGRLLKLLCLFGHDWRLEAEVDVPPEDTDSPVFFEPGGVDYHLRCIRCGSSKIDRCRSVWLPRNYKPL